METYLRTREQKEELVVRVRVLSAVVGLALAVVLGSYWVVQGIHGPDYRERAEHNRLRRSPLMAPRGIVYDRDDRPLAENVPSYNLLLQPRATLELEASLDFAAAILEKAPAELARELAEQRAKNPVQPALIAQNLTLPQVARFESATLEHPEFEIQVEQVRLYRHREQTAHVLGYLSEINREELAGAEGSYLRGELIGRRGVEAAYEEVLRGRNGERVLVVDSRGRPIEEYGRREAVAGQGLQLALDLDLQQAAARAMEGRIGAVVALDPRNGEVRVMYSAPAYDPNRFARRIAPGEWRALIDAPYNPLQNRAIQNTHSPGSTFKMVMALGGLKEGVITPESRVFCGGSAVYYGHRRRCWKRGGHGSVALYAAIKGSCDVYFYEVGQRLGIDRIATYARQFGFGTRTGVDLPGEKAGLVPDSEWSQQVRKHAWYPGETISVAIGQGPLLVTPLQMAVMVAAVANGGRLPVPHLVQPQEPPRGESPEFSQAQWTVVRKGMWGVVNDFGTAARSRVEGMDVAGKTGTVQVVAHQAGVDSADLPFEKRDHAWFVAYAPFEAPELVVVVFVEHGEGGSRTAAPIAKAVYETFLVERPDLRRPPAS